MSIGYGYVHWLLSLMQICFIFFLSFSNNTYKIIVDIFVLIIFLVHIYKTFNNTSFYTADTSVYVRISEFIRIMCYISSLLIAIFQFGIDSLPNDVDLLGFIIFESILAYLLVSVSHRNDNLYIKKGISRDLETANKIKSILEEQNKKVTIKEKYLTNKEFKETVTQFDNLINETQSHEEILKIEETVIATYEEILRNNTNS